MMSLLLLAVDLASITADLLARVSGRQERNHPARLVVALAGGLGAGISTPLRILVWWERNGRV